MDYDVSSITPEMALAELKRRGVNLGNRPQSNEFDINSITPDMARAELNRRKSLQPTSAMKLNIPEIQNQLRGMKELAGYNPNKEQIQNRQLSPDTFTPEWEKNATGYRPELANALVSAGAGATANALVPGSGLLASLGRITAGTGASTAVDALNPEKRDNLKEESKKNLLINGLIETLPAAFKSSGKLASKFRPGKYGKEFIDSLGKGMTVDESTQSAAKDIRNLVNGKVKEASEKYYDPIENAVGSEKIYENKPNLSMNQSIRRDMGVRLRDDFDEFLKDPTYSRAHKIQSDLGKKGHKLLNSDLGADNNAGEELLSLKDKLQNHIKDFLGRKDEDLLNKYNEGTEFYGKEVIPYLKDKTFSKIYYGNEITPKTIPNRFSKMSAEESNLSNKAASELGSDFVDKLLHSQLGKSSFRTDPAKLAAGIQKLRETGFGKYITPEINNAENELAKRLALKKIGQYGTSGTVGSGLAFELYKLLGSK